MAGDSSTDLAMVVAAPQRAWGRVFPAGLSVFQLCSVADGGFSSCSGAFGIASVVFDMPVARLIKNTTANDNETSSTIANTSSVEQQHN